MKFKTSVTFDQKTIEDIRELIRTSDLFRNKSHVVEEAIKKFWEVKRDE